MNQFIHDNFLLENKKAEQLYHDHVSHLPIIDFHNHLVPKDIAEDRIFENISQLWLEGDHYKWRAMRSNGVSEKYITGNSTDWEKFLKWADTVPKTLRSPLYHWTHLELKRYFEISQLLDHDSAQDIYKICNEKVKSREYSVQHLLRKMNIQYLCTTEDPTYDFGWHQKVKDRFEIKVSSAFRPDQILDPLSQSSFTKYITRLENVYGNEIDTYQKLCSALETRHDFFHQQGSRLADFALDWFTYVKFSDYEADKVFRKILLSKDITTIELDGFRTSILVFLCELNFNKGWVQQFHMGALRNINRRGVEKVGPACGFDAMNDLTYVAEVGRFLNHLEERSKLTKSIFFNLNPRDNAAVITLINSFNDGSTKGKMQFGPPWWFLDQKEGIEKHLNDLSAYGVIGNFIGMLTDSRSFLSFPRHEYFRRILCNVFGKDMEAGLIPNDEKIVADIIRDICYNNVKSYLGVD